MHNTDASIECWSRGFINVNGSAVVLLAPKTAVLAGPIMKIPDKAARASGYVFVKFECLDDGPAPLACVFPCKFAEYGGYPQSFNPSSVVFLEMEITKFLCQD